MKQEKMVCIPVLFGGRSSSGKSTFVEALKQELGDDLVTVISGDNYYKDVSYKTPEEIADYNFDHPSAIDKELLLKHIRKIKKGETIHVPGYSFSTHGREKGKDIIPKRLVLIDSVLAFAIDEILEEVDCTIFVSYPPDKCLIRRFKRDTGMDGGEGRNRTPESVLEQWSRFVEPSFLDFIKSRIKYATIIVPGDFSPMTVKFVAGGLKNLYINGSLSKK